MSKLCPKNQKQKMWNRLIYRHYSAEIKTADIQGDHFGSLVFQSNFKYTGYSHNANSVSAISVNVKKCVLCKNSIT